MFLIWQDSAKNNVIAKGALELFGKEINPEDFNVYQGAAGFPLVILRFAQDDKGCFGQVPGLQEGIGGPFVADGRNRSVSGQYPDVAVQGKQFRMKAGNQPVVVSAGMVGPADASGKERIAREENAFAFGEETYAALRMPGGGDHLQGGPAEGEGLAIGQVVQDAGERLEGQAQLPAPFGGTGQLFVVGGVNPRIDIPETGGIFQTEDMVEMAVRQQDRDRPERPVGDEILDPLQLPVAVTPGIDQDARPARVPDKMTAFPQGIAVERLYLHKNRFKHTKIRKDVVIL